MLLTRAPLASGPEGPSSFDLHVLSLPPAFVLSQDQTLKLIGASLAHHVRITINREASQLLVYVWILRKRPSSTERRLRIPFVQSLHNVKERTRAGSGNPPNLAENQPIPRRSSHAPRLRETGF